MLKLFSNTEKISITSQLPLKRCSPNHLIVQFILFFPLALLHFIRTFPHVLHNRQWLSFSCFEPGRSSSVWDFELSVLLHKNIVVIIGLVQLCRVELPNFQLVKIHLLQHLPIHLFLVEIWTGGLWGGILLCYDFGVFLLVFGLLFNCVIFLLFFLEFFDHSDLALFFHESSLFGSFGLFDFFGFGDGLIFEFLFFLIEFCLEFLEAWVKEISTFLVLMGVGPV